MGSPKAKISDVFLARLAALGPGKKLRAIVMLAGAPPTRTSQRRRTRQERRAAVEQTRNASEKALASVDLILERCDGKRLAQDVNALGCVPIETTAAGIKALADAPEVESIMEDQGIGLIERPKKRRR